MAAFNYDRAQKVTGRQIRRFGQKALLRRNGTDRKCTIAFTDIFAKDTNGQLVNPLSLKAVVAADDQSVPPDYQLDSVVTLNQSTLAELEELRLTGPTSKLGPGASAIYWEVTVQQPKVTG